MKKILSPAYSLKLKNINLLLNRGLIFLWNGLIGNVVSTLPNVVKTDVEIHNVVSKLPNVVQFNVEIHNVVSMLLNVVNFNVDVYNVASTMIWRCATSRRHVNLKATLNRRWNVCWVCSNSYKNSIWKLCILNPKHFRVIHPWILYFPWKLAYFLMYSIVCEQTFRKFYE